ncbi:hypothetical protein KAR29_13375 [Aminithiophilus ramosus]|uniref:Uncharacterized protein n=1 Tax=Aminithiophilus ramosus TaxID=3029084 RepID=A0A9Q7EV85_9BACT|nr:hypothetical protein [Aminithiophilus ramosus]QTX32273.1 hypothetical protein KAR29_13375 [Aminithiophilus ramosus]
MDNRNFLSDLLDSIDSISKILLLDVWWRRHASIVDLRRDLSCRNDFEIIYRIKHIINTNSEKILGYSIIVFKESKIDPCDGKQWFFQWWFVDEIGLNKEFSCMDIYSEGNKITLIASVNVVPRIPNEMSHIIEYRNGVLKITLDKE